MKTPPQASNGWNVQPEDDKRKLRPRRPITLSIDSLPDDALVAKDVRRAITGLGDSQTYELIRQRRFPAALKLGARCSCWKMGDLRRWLADPLGYGIDADKSITTCILRNDGAPQGER